jgi:hypothetical protein
LLRPAHGGGPPSLVWMANNGYMLSRKVRKRVLANGCACAKHRHRKNVLRGFGYELTRCEIVRPAFDEKDLMAMPPEPILFESRWQYSNGPAFA